MTSKSDEELQRVHMLEQNLQSVAVQKQQFQAQLFEVEGALRELSSSEEAFKIVGGLMIRSDKDSLQNDLESKKEMFELRLESLEKQEEQMKRKIKDFQQLRE